MAINPNVFGRWGTILLFFTCFFPSILRGSENSYIFLGNKAYSKRQYSQAERFYLQACRDDPQNAGAYYAVGLCEYLRRNLATAETYTERAVALDPRLQTAQALLRRIRMRRGYRAYSEGQYVQAERFYLQACRGYPQNAGAFYAVGLFEYLRGNLATAKAYSERAVTLDRRLQPAQTLLKRIRAKLHQREVQDLEFLVLMEEGVMYYRLHQYGTALTTLQEAALLNPSSADLHFNLGATYMKLKDWDKAMKEMEYCLKMDPLDKRAQYAFGILCQEAGATSEAQFYFSSVAQSPIPGVYNMEAMQRLCALRADPSNAALHFFMRLQGGAGQNALDQTGPIAGGSPPLLPIGSNQLGLLQLSYTPRWGKALMNFSYNLNGAWNEAPGQVSSFTDLHDLSVNAGIPLPSNWMLPLTYDEQAGLNSSGGFYYEHHQGTAALQWFFKNTDLLQFQVQYLRELYPLAGVDMNDWIGSVTSSLVFGNTHFFTLSYSFRQCVPDTVDINTAAFNYSLQTLSATYHIELGHGWNASINYTPQWQTFPITPYGTPGSEMLQNASGEFTIPMSAHWNFVLGDQFQAIQSAHSPTPNSHSNNYYAATQVFF